MNRFFKGFLIVAGALVLVGALIFLKIHLSSQYHQSVQAQQENADIPSLIQKIRNDSLYAVKDILYKDSAMVIAVSVPEKTGTENYFDRKYRLNSFGNINMVYIYKYDSLKPLQSASPDEALMATGKKMGRFQLEWIKQFIDTADGSCIPLKKILQTASPHPGSFKNQETVYQPSSIHNMQVICKYYIMDSLGNSGLHIITALVDKDGSVKDLQAVDK